MTTVHAIGDGMTLMECRHPQFVDSAAQPNGLGPDQRDWRTIPAYRERLERAKRDIETIRLVTDAQDRFRGLATIDETAEIRITGQQDQFRETMRTFAEVKNSFPLLMKAKQ